MLIVVFSLVPAAVSADEIVANTDSTLQMFTDENSSSLEGWTGFSKTANSSIDSDTWFTYNSTDTRLEGYVIANYPQTYSDTTSPTSTALYNKMNFGSEYSVTGELYVYQNQTYIYFNTAANITDTGISISNGYRIMFNVSQKTLSLQQCIQGTWTNLCPYVEITKPRVYGKYQYTLTFVDGLIDFNAVDANDNTYSYSISHDLTEESYYDVGYFGFGTSASKLLASNINVAYNSSKVYAKPSLSGYPKSFKPYAVYSVSEPIVFQADLDINNASDLKRAVLTIDNVNQEMSYSNKSLSASVTGLLKGVHNAKLTLEDKYGELYEVAEFRFLVSDYNTSACDFENSQGEAVVNAEDAVGDVVKAVFEFSQPTQCLNSLVAFIAVYNADGSIAEISHNVYETISANQTYEISVQTNTSLQSGQTVTAFLCESLTRSFPTSGAFFLE